MSPRRPSSPGSERRRSRRDTSASPAGSIGTWTRRPSDVTTTATWRRSSGSNQPNGVSTRCGCSDPAACRQSSRDRRRVNRPPMVMVRPPFGSRRERSQLLDEPVGAPAEGRRGRAARSTGDRSAGRAGSPGRRRCRASGRPRAGPGSRSPRRRRARPTGRRGRAGSGATSSDASWTAPPWTSDRSILTMSNRSWLSSRSPAFPAPTSSAASRMPATRQASPPGAADRDPRPPRARSARGRCGAGRGRGGRSSGAGRGC